MHFLEALTPLVVAQNFHVKSVSFIFNKFIYKNYQQHTSVWGLHDILGRGNLHRFFFLFDYELIHVKIIVIFYRRARNSVLKRGGRGWGGHILRSLVRLQRLLGFQRSAANLVVLNFSQSQTAVLQKRRVGVLHVLFLVGPLSKVVTCKIIF